MSHAEKQENHAAWPCVFTLVKARGQYTKHCRRDANLLHLVAVSVVREVPQCRCSTWKRAVSVSTPGAETRLLMILDVSFFTWRQLNHDCQTYLAITAAKEERVKNAAVKTSKRIMLKSLVTNLQQLWVVEQTASEKAASCCRTKKNPHITLCCSKKMTAQSWRCAKKACEISVRSCQLEPFHVNCVSSKCCSTNWAVNMELWTLASECSWSWGARRRALPPSFAARVYTSPLDARPPAVRERCTAQGELSVLLCHPHPTKSSKTLLKRSKKKRSLEAGKFLSGLNFILVRGALALALLLLRRRWVHMECLQLGCEEKKCRKACTSAANARSDLACII